MFAIWNLETDVWYMEPSKEYIRLFQYKLDCETHRLLLEGNTRFVVLPATIRFRNYDQN